MKHSATEPRPQPSPKSLSPLFTPSQSPTSALYGHDHMAKGDYPRLSHLDCVVLAHSNIVGGYLSLCNVLSQLHRGLTNTLLEPVFDNELFKNVLESFAKMDSQKVRGMILLCPL